MNNERIIGTDYCDFTIVYKKIVQKSFIIHHSSFISLLVFVWILSFSSVALHKLVVDLLFYCEMF